MMSSVPLALAKRLGRAATFWGTPASHFRVMRYRSRSLTLALLVGVCLSALTAQALPRASRLRERPAGCHEHRHDGPVPRPASHVCCLAGRDSAILQPSFWLRPSVQALPAILLAQPAAGVTLIRSIENLQASSGSPLGIDPLRI